MLKSNFILAIRNILRNASNSMINVSGLALGITCALLIFSLVSYHLGFDNFHKDSDRIYRFVTEQHRDEATYVGSVPPAFGNTFKNEFDYAEKIVRMCVLNERLVSFERNNALQKFTETGAFVDPEFFEVFNFPMVSGDGAKLMAEPNVAIITERIAKKYFGNESALDKTIRFANTVDFKIVGVLTDIPDNTDIRSEIYFSWTSLKQISEWYAADDSWGGITTEIQEFAKLRAGVNPADVEKALETYPKRFRPNSKNVHVYKLQPLSDIHFNAHYGGVMEKKTLIIISVVGFFLILTACLNFINLATAQAITRSKEIGVRKTLGSKRSQLFGQFATETGITVVVATAIAFAVAHTLLPVVNELFSTRVQFRLDDSGLLMFIPALVVVVTLLSCTYPGLVLSGFKPVLALKGKLSGKDSFKLRRSLITVQFTISQVLLIGLIVVLSQMKFFRETSMGFDSSAIVMIPTGSQDEKMKTLKAKFEQIPNVEKVTTCFTSPASQNFWNTSLYFDNRAEQEDFSITHRGGDEDYLPTFGLKLVAGRNIEPADTVREFVVNETLVRKLGTTPEDILGKNLRVNGDWSGPIVGVIQDFHDQSLHADINPVFITTSSEFFFTYGVKIDLQHSKETLAALERAWSETYPELIYEYDFLDDITAEFYQTEETMLQLIEVFAFIALFISCLGLYGMAAFMSLQKTKEIGIRKVLGGSIAHILWIFGKEFSRLILIAFIIAAPAGWYLMSSWLENFEFRIELGVWIFAVEIIIIAAIVLLTVGYKALRAAITNPVNSLRTE